MGRKFRRQQPIGSYVTDFCCLQEKLIVEADGGQHISNKEQDEHRTRFLEKEGFKVLRFWDNDILRNRNAVTKIILEHLKTIPSPQPSPPRGEGGKP